MVDHVADGYVDPGSMTAKVRRRRAGSALEQPFAEFEELVLRLTDDLEKFELAVREQRQRLLRAGRPGAYDDDVLGHESRRLAGAADDIISKARAALAELKQLSERTDTTPREPPPGRTGR